MQGWMVRFADGPFAGRSFGPISEMIPEDVIVKEIDGECAIAAYNEDLLATLVKHGMAVHHYRRRSMSELTDEQAGHPHLIRGAEYALVT